MVGLMKERSGFTLAEVLIALALLGVIAAFLIPTLISTQAERKRIAAFRETYSILSQTIYDGALSKGYGTTGPSFSSYLLTHINTQKACPNNATTDGCWTAPADPNGESVQAGFVMPNGVVVVGLALADYATASGYGPPSYGIGNGLLIDYNGADPPNQWGEDRLSLFFCADVVTGTCSTPHTSGRVVRSGYLAPADSSEQPSKDLFAEITR